MSDPTERVQGVAVLVEHGDFLVALPDEAATHVVHSLSDEARATRREAVAVEIEAFVRGGDFDDTDCGEAIADAVLRVLGLDDQDRSQQGVLS